MGVCAVSASLALFRAKQAGVEITLDGDKLRLSAASPAPSVVLELLAAHKSEIITLLQRRELPAQQVDRGGPTSAGSTPCVRAYTPECHRFEGGPPRSTSVPTSDEAAEIKHILADAERAVPDPGRYDHPADRAAEWAGEFEEPVFTDATDYGDEREHDAWLSGVPIADLKP